jgi:hypothetical protein
LEARKLEGLHRIIYRSGAMVFQDFAKLDIVAFK